MATAMKKKTTVKPVNSVTTDEFDLEPVTEVVEEQNELEEIETVKTVKPAKRKFAADEEIECISIFPGQYFVKGERSGDLYTFAGIDDVQYIRYDDLDYLCKRNKPCIFKPRFIIQDKDFLDQHPTVEPVYGNLYSTADLKAILKLPASQMKERIKTLPIGAKDAIKVIASTQVDNGTLDSVRTVKALDEVFGTSMLARITGTF